MSIYKNFADMRSIDASYDDRSFRTQFYNVILSMVKDLGPGFVLKALLNAIALGKEGALKYVSAMFLSNGLKNIIKEKARIAQADLDEISLEGLPEGDLVNRSNLHHFSNENFGLPAISSIFKSKDGLHELGKEVTRNRWLKLADDSVGNALERLELEVNDVLDLAYEEPMALAVYFMNIYDYFKQMQGVGQELYNYRAISRETKQKMEDLRIVCLNKLSKSEDKLR